MLGQEDGGAQVVDQALEDREDLFGGRRVECGGRFVQDQDPGCGVRTEPIATRCC
ncbi:hypothetical protein SHKM778_74640 [Streptomyces sp. KM77-8]|uniref:Uncharacterized protein n=1 Tax=Streptomyces haneummycinicus TaxID=3074435 RepID=A0AAT9HVP6_9ACTN